jgi:hypothetical protein
MKLNYCFTALMAVACTSISFGQISYDFNSDAEGWRRANFNPSTLQLTVLGSATWNSSGYIDADDFSNWAFHLSPELSGGFQGATQISFDYSTQNSDGVYPFVILRAGGQAIFQSLQPPADNQFHNYNYALTPGSWTWSDGSSSHIATSTEINTVLAGMNQIGISADNSVGAEYTRLDNVRLVPEPASFAALGLGLLALRRRETQRAS